MKLIAWHLAAICVVLSASPPAFAQSLHGQRQAEEQERALEQRRRAERQRERAPSQGKTAETSVGTVGQRQTRSAPVANIKPTKRINNRVANRVQNRVPNRIDPGYDPAASATSPFARAEDQVRINR